MKINGKEYVLIDKEYVTKEIDKAIDSLSRNNILETVSILNPVEHYILKQNG